MKTHAFRQLLLLCPFLFLLITCKKDKDNDNENNFRVVAEEYFYNGDADGEATFKYLENKISEYRYEEDENYSEVATFDYSEADKINIEYTSYEEGDEYNGEMVITLEDGKIIEFMEVDNEKFTLTYNGSDQVEKVKTYYDDGTGWILFSTLTFDYNGNKLMEILYEETEGEKSKDIYAYDGDDVDEIVSSYYNGADWVEEYRNVYSYSSGKVTKIEYYYSYDGDWVKGEVMQFSYDENGNLASSSELNDEYDDEYVTEYTYEEGSGNYSLIFGNFYFNDDGYVDFPMPVKNALRNKDASGINNTISLCRSLKNHDSLTGIHGMHTNRSSAGRNK